MKHTRLTDAVAASDYDFSPAAKTLVSVRFYEIHGPAEGFALAALPSTPHF